MNFLSKVISVLGNNGGSLDTEGFLFIPEPTRSLLWITDEHPSKRKSPTEITLTITLSSKGITSEKSVDKGNFLSEPSLIWKRLPINNNAGLEKDALYHPSYYGLTPEQRFQYLVWLKDITQPTNLSYVFLYFYGLERHLLIGNYDRAVDEILRLMKYHDKGSFKSYAVDSLIAASVFRKRSDIADRDEVLFSKIDHLGLAIRFLRGDSLSADDLIMLSPKVGFRSGYIKKQVSVFRESLRKVISDYVEKNGSLVEGIDPKEVPIENAYCFANSSIPSEIRNIPFPHLLSLKRFKDLLYQLLDEAHQVCKETLKINRQKNIST